MVPGIVFSSTLAKPSQELAEKRTLTGVGWNELDRGGLEHKMSTSLFFIRWILIKLSIVAIDLRD